MQFYCREHGSFVINATVTTNPTCPYVLFRVGTRDVPCGRRLIPLYPKTELSEAELIANGTEAIPE